MLKEDITQLQELKVTTKTTGFLKEMASWTTFLSILGFVGIGFLVILAILMKFVLGDAFSSMPNATDMPFNMGNFAATMYLIIAFIYYFPVMYLYKFSTKIKNAIVTKSNETFEDAFEMLKSHFKYLGVLFIIIISLYLLLIVGALLFGLSSF